MKKIALLNQNKNVTFQLLTVFPMHNKEPSISNVDLYSILTATLLLNVEKIRDKLIVSQETKLKSN